MTEITTLNATLEYGKEKLDALHVYLKQSDAEFQATLNIAATEAVDALYKKNVPTTVQAFISLMNGEVKPDKKAKMKKPKPTRQDESATDVATKASIDECGAYY
ncbi:MAG: DUF6103 family protein [Oscillospiraceae bacterium]